MKWTLLLAAAGLAVGAHAADLAGRLFFTQEERVALDRLRRDKGESLPGAAEAATAPIRIDGVVRRAGGRSTVWIDGEPRYLPEASSAPVRVRPATRGQGVTVETASRQIGLKVGQHYDPTTGTMEDLVGKGSASTGGRNGK